MSRALLLVLLAGVCVCVCVFACVCEPSFSSLWIYSCVNIHTCVGVQTNTFANLWCMQHRYKMFFKCKMYTKTGIKKNKCKKWTQKNKFKMRVKNKCSIVLGLWGVAVNLIDFTGFVWCIFAAFVGIYVCVYTYVCVCVRARKHLCVRERTVCVCVRARASSRFLSLSLH